MWSNEINSGLNKWIEMDAYEQAKLNSEITIEPIRPSIKQEVLDTQEDGQSAAVNAALRTEGEKGDASSDEPDEPPANPWARVKCVICSVVLSPSNQPKLLECLHAACAACVSAKLHEQPDTEVIENMIECPTCHVICNSQNIIDNQFLAELESDVDAEPKNNDLRCSSCSDNALAVSYCVDCAEFICNSCVEAHQRLKITKDHTIKRKEEAEAEVAGSGSQRSIFCSVHPHEQLSLFCEVCDKLTCRDCQLSEHREHKYKFVHEIATETRSVISGLLSEVSYKRVLLKSAMKVIDDRQALIADKKKVLVKEITQMVVRLTNTINARGKQLVLRLNEVCDSKQKTLSEKKAALEQLSLLTDHCIEFVGNALGKGSDMALLYSKKSVTSHLQRIKARRADIPNPEIPVRISLAFEKVPELIRVVSSIGAIVVDGRMYPPREDPPVNNNKQEKLGSPPSDSRTYVAPPSPYQANQGATHGQHGQHSPHGGGTNMRPPTPSATPPLPGRNRVSPLGQVAHQLGPHSSRNMMGQRNQTVQHFPVNGAFGPAMMGMAGQGVNVPPPPPLHQGGINSHLMQMRPGNHSQQVTSSTHPSSDPNIRNLLQQGMQQGFNPVNNNQIARMNGHKMRVQPNQFQQNQFSQGNNFTQQVRNTMRNQLPPPPYPTLSQVQAGAQWHIPQQHVSLNSSRPTPASIPIDESFKIHLKTQNGEVRPNVTSSVPKTPSPGTVKEDPSIRMDKFCQDSVNDLMATIAKLDSNGIEVIPEMGERQGSEGMVDSSTGSASFTATKPAEPKDDSNEDWCAVCMDGGELICCDNCPKVFHVNCHIPPLHDIPGENETWQCLLCSDVANLVPPEEEMVKRKHGLAFNERKVAERILLELYCQYETSLHFRDMPTDPAVLEKLERPMTLDMIRRRLDPSSSEHYPSLQRFLSDLRWVFKNARGVYSRDSQAYQDGKLLEEFLERLLARWLPDLAFTDTDSDGEGRSEPVVKRPKRDGEE